MTKLCPHFPTCGGCLFQDKPMAVYTAMKHDALLSLFKGTPLEKIELLPARLSPEGTRRRARLAACLTKKGVLLGFNQRRSHTIVDMQHCTVLLPALVDLIKALKPYLKPWLETAKEGKGDVQLTLLDSGIDLVLIGGTLSLAAREACADIAENLSIAQISWKKGDRSATEPVVHRALLTRQFNDVLVPFPPGSFLQATQEGENALISFAQKAAGDAEKILDLFSGLGGFGLSFPNAKKVTFADWDGPAIHALSRAVDKNPRYAVLKRDLIKDPLSADECKPFDLLLFDPPRGGAKKQAAEIAKSNAPKVIAVSCDPPTFVRDASILIANGYKIDTIQPVDQFLYTPHQELIALAALPMCS